MITEISINTSHNQISFFDPSLENPFNDWNETHVDQGFVSRDQSLSCMTLIESGTHTVRIERLEKVDDPSEMARRVFMIPFEVKTGFLEIAGIAESETLRVPSGTYTLQVEFFEPDSPDRALVLLKIVPEAILVQHQVLVADEGLNVPDVLDLQGGPAM